MDNVSLSQFVFFPFSLSSPSCFLLALYSLSFILSSHPPSGPGRLLLCCQHGRQHSVCVGECQPVFALPAGGADEHQRLQRAACWRSHRVHQEPPAQEPG